MALLEVSHLKKYFQVSSGILHAVDDVSFTLEQGKTLGVVGESGCGKSTLGKTIIRLTDPTAGTVLFDAVDVAAYSSKEVKRMTFEVFTVLFGAVNEQAHQAQDADDLSGSVRLTGPPKDGDRADCRAHEDL